MTKKELVEKVKEKAQVNGRQAKAAVEAVLEAISEALASGDKVQLVGFGTFSVRERKARTATKPGTKEKVTVPARKVAAFKASPELNKRVGGK